MVKEKDEEGGYPSCWCRDKRKDDEGGYPSCWCRDKRKDDKGGHGHTLTIGIVLKERGGGLTPPCLCRVKRKDEEDWSLLVGVMSKDGHTLSVRTKTCGNRWEGLNPPRSRWNTSEMKRGGGLSPLPT